MEPRATPAATRGQNPCPHPGNTTTKTDSETETEHEHCYTPESPKHLKYVVLTPEASQEHRVIARAAADYERPPPRSYHRTFCAVVAPAVITAPQAVLLKPCNFGKREIYRLLHK